LARPDYDRSRAGSSCGQKVDDAGSTFGNLVTIIMAALAAAAAIIAASITAAAVPSVS